MRADATTAGVDARLARPTGAVLRRGGVGLLLLIVLAALVGLAFAGPRSELAPGVAIAGVDVGGMNLDEARRLLETRSRELAHTPVVFTAGKQRFAITPQQLSIEADWSAAVERARDAGGGFGPLRGFRRLHARLTGIEIAPEIQAYTAALHFKASQLAHATDRPHVEASLRLRGLAVVAVPGQSGQKLDHDGAERTLVRALGSLERTGPVQLPVAVDPVQVTTDDLAAAKARAELAISGPVRLAYGETRFKLPRWRIAELLSLPRDGETSIAIAGPGADAYFAKLQDTVDREPVDARFEVTSGGIIVVPAKDGLTLNVPETAKALLGAAVSPDRRVAEIAVVTAPPERTTADAKAMGITGVVGSYQTTYGGIPERLHNVALVAKLIDGTLIAPGKQFSFNGTTGERTAEKGFEQAPVIINGELQTGLGGGICQVSTTVFNAAFESGLAIDERYNHALYISHYPLGRDATVNYPDQDLKFTNDTGHWLLLRTFVGTGSLVVNLYGTPVDRRVEVSTAPLTPRGATPVKRVPDPSLLKGQSKLESTGVPPRYTHVNRKVYDAKGVLLHDDSWGSSYVSEPTIMRVGTKPKPKPAKDGARADAVQPPVADPPAATTTTQP